DLRADAALVPQHPLFAFRGAESEKQDFGVQPLELEEDVRRLGLALPEPVRRGACADDLEGRMPLTKNARRDARDVPSRAEQINAPPAARRHRAKRVHQLAA